jgi:hypothetical protein
LSIVILSITEHLKQWKSLGHCEWDLQVLFDL